MILSINCAAKPSMVSDDVELNMTGVVKGK
jgi:hypothetical protein